jgi:hypothetical protein
MAHWQQCPTIKITLRTLHPLKPNESNHIAGVNGRVIPVKGRGNVKWKLEDDDGVVHKIKIKNALYVPEMQMCLLCAQHSSQNLNDHFPKWNGTWCASYADECILYWNQCRHMHTIKWDHKTNTVHQGGDFWNQNDSYLNQNDGKSKRPNFNMRSKISHKLANLVLICESQSNQRRPCLTWDLVLHCLTRWFWSIIGHK